MATPSKVALVIGASGYIGEAVARAFVQASYRTLGSIRTTSSAGPDLQRQGIVPVVGDASDRPAFVQGVSDLTDRLDVVVVATEDRSAAHFDETNALLHELARVSSVRPLVIYSSGTKDYGPGKLDGDPDLQPDTEESPLNTPQTLAGRTEQGLKVLTYSEHFDAVAVRPTNVHGYASSYYGQFLYCANAARQRPAPLVFPGDARTILHSVHVDDCGAAYVALANHPDRSRVAGQIFNISAGKKYETLGQLAKALETEMQLGYAIKCEPKPLSGANISFAWSQWVDSEKIRNLTGWTDTRPMFAEGIGRYRKEFDEAVANGDRTASRMLPRFESSIDGFFREA